MNRALIFVLCLLSGFHARHAWAEPQYTAQELIERLAGETRWSAEEELAKRFSETREAVRAGLKHPNPSVRRGLIRLIESSHDQSFYPDLLALTKDLDAGVRGEVLQVAIEWRGDLGKQIVNTMLSDEAPNNRGSAVIGLWKLDQKNALPEMSRIVEADTDTARVGVAVLILAARGDRRVRLKALELTRAIHESTRKNAVESLGYIGEASDIELLKSISASKTERIRMRGAAMRAEVQLKFELKGAAEKHAILLDSLRSEDLMKRRWAAGVLLRRGDEVSKRVLQDASKDRTHPGWAEAADALSVDK